MEPNWLEKIWVGEVSPTYWWSGFIVDKVCGFNITLLLSEYVGSIFLKSTFFWSEIDFIRVQVKLIYIYIYIYIDEQVKLIYCTLDFLIEFTDLVALINKKKKQFYLYQENLNSIQ